MSESLQVQKARGGFAPTFWELLVAFLIYALSIGPAFKLIEKGQLPFEVRYLYHPLDYAPFGLWKATDWYVHDVWKCSRFGL